MEPEISLALLRAHLISTLVMSPEPPLAASFSRGKPSAKAVSPDVGLRPTAQPLAREASQPLSPRVFLGK